MKNPLAALSEPVRLYGAIAAALALVVHYHPDLPIALILGLVGAVLGVGEAVRNTVTPEKHITTVTDPMEAFDLLTQDTEFQVWIDEGGAQKPEDE